MQSQKLARYYWSPLTLASFDMAQDRLAPFDKHVLRISAVSFDTLRTNG